MEMFTTAGCKVAIRSAVLAAGSSARAGNSVSRIAAATVANHALDLDNRHITAKSSPLANGLVKHDVLALR